MKRLTVLIVGSLYKPTTEDLRLYTGNLGTSRGAEPGAVTASNGAPPANVPAGAVESPATVSTHESGKTPPASSPSGANAGQAETSLAASDDKRLKQAQKAYDETFKPQFEAACRAIGAAFARKGWRVMVGATAWSQWTDRQTIAPFVLQGINSVPLPEGSDGHEVIFYVPREHEDANALSGNGTSNANPTDAAATLQKISTDHKNLLVKYKFNAPGVYKSKLIPNVVEVDAVVLVHGSEGTSVIGYAAYCMNRPVIAVSGLGPRGGEARRLYQDVMLNVYERYKESVQLADEELLLLTAPWSAKADDGINERNATAVVSTAEKLAKGIALADRKTTRTLTGAMLGMLALLLAWAGVYLASATVAERLPAAPAQTAVTTAPAEGVQPEPARAVAADASKAADMGSRSAAPEARNSDRDGSSQKTEGAVAQPEKGSTSATSMAGGKSLPQEARKSDREAPSQKAQGAAAQPPKGSISPPSSKGEEKKGQERNSKGARDDADRLAVRSSFFLLLFLSSAIGSGLRVLVAFQRNQLTQLSGLGLLLEVTVSLAVAFGLALFYMIGSISFTGQVTLLGEAAKNFATIAVSMSLLGLCAGYLLPIDKLKGWLLGLVEKK